MNDKPETIVGYVSPLKRICMTIGELPTSYLETMTYYEMLVWFTKFLQEKVIPTIDNNAHAVEELQHLFIELQNYVNNYFENLDVQEEINNKIDNMVEQGTLQEIIADYLNSKAVFGFDNVNSMKTSTNLINGSYAKTLGFYSINDGGNALYKVRTITNDDVVDEMRIIALNDNTLIAELVIDENTNVKKFGAKGDDLHDDTSNFNAYIDWCNTNNKNIRIPLGKYRIYNDLHSLNRNVCIIGELGNNAMPAFPNNKSLILDYRESNNYLINYNQTSPNGNDGNSIFNVSFTDANRSGLKCINFRYGGYKSKIENCDFSRYLQAIYIKSTHGTILSNVNCRYCGGNEDNNNTYAIEIEDTSNVKMIDCMLEYCRWNVYTHGSVPNFVMDKCYFELVTAYGLKGNEPLVISGGELTNNYFCTRPMETIATAINDTTTNVYYMLKILNYTKLDGNEFEIGSNNDGTPDNNKKQGKHLTTNESGIFNIVNNYFNYTAFEVPGIKLQSYAINLCNNVVNANLEEVLQASNYRLIDDLKYGSHGINTYFIRNGVSASTQTYIPRFERYNHLPYTIKSSDNYFTNKTIRSYTKCATLVIQGTSGIFDLIIENKGYTGTFYKASIFYNIDSSSEEVTILNTEVSRLQGSSTIKFIKSGTKLIIQFMSALNTPVIFNVENKTEKICEYNVDIDEITEGVIHTISS